MTLPPPRHRQRRIHMHIMARQIQRDEPLEQQRPARPGGGEEDEQAGGGAAVGDHVEDGAELGGLVEVAGGDAVEGVEEAGDAVEEGAGAGVEGHVVEGGESEDYAGVAWGVLDGGGGGGGIGRAYQVGPEEEDVFWW